MILDARTLESGTSLEADICLAGAGAAGITLALDLHRSGRSVLLLESGGLGRESETQRLYEGRMIGIDTWRLDRMRVRALGGSTGHWTGFCRPLLKHDFERRDYLPNSGWPIRYEDLVPSYEQACRTVQIGPFEWDMIARAKAMGMPLLPLGAAVDQRYYQFSPPTRFGQFYRRMLDRAEDLRVVLYANVTDVRLEAGLGRVSSFTCRTLGGVTFHAHAGRYVLALGGIENARLLLASRSQQREGVANGHDVVGRYFMEHPHYFGSVGLVHLAKLNRSFLIGPLPSDLKHWRGRLARVRVAGALGLAADIVLQEGLLEFSALFRGASSEWGALPLTTVEALLTRGKAAAEPARLTLRTEQSPQPESRVLLTEELDALGMPRVALDWRIAPEDQEKLRRALVILGSELAAAGIARAWLPGDASRFIWRPVPGGHHMGTTRMGTDPAVSVVDADCRTHQVQNLYIAGSSVFPTGGDANPTLTLVALAHRLAATLKST